MQLTVLVDNNTLIDKYLIAEPGACYITDNLLFLGEIERGNDTRQNFRLFPTS